MNENKAIAILRQVRAEVGRPYKSKIRTAWETGAYDSMGLKIMLVLYNQSATFMALVG